MVRSEPFSPDICGQPSACASSDLSGCGYELEHSFLASRTGPSAGDGRSSGHRPCVNARYRSVRRMDPRDESGRSLRLGVAAHCRRGCSPQRLVDRIARPRASRCWWCLHLRTSSAGTSAREYCRSRLCLRQGCLCRRCCPRRGINALLTQFCLYRYFAMLCINGGWNVLHFTPSAGVVTICINS